MRRVLWPSVALGLGLAAWGQWPPPSRGAEAPAGEFSAARALGDVDFLAAAPRPVGSAHHEVAREYLEQRLLGLGAELDPQDSVVDGRAVTNVVARFAGTAVAREAVLLCAHYDSVAAGPGAGDDAMGCAAVLEIARALAAGPQSARDLIVLLTDGEEIALLGARAFLEGGDGRLPPHPWAERVGLVLNFEARGGGGPAYAFQTSRRNGALVAALARAPWPAGSSLAKAVYERMPNDTDLTVFLGRPVAGLNFACIDRFASYHTALDTPARLDPGSLQQMGDQGLAVARWALGADAEFHAPDAAYFNLLGRLFVHHPLTWTPAIAALAVALGACALGRLRARASACALGALAVLAAAALPALLVFAAARVLPAAFSLAASHRSDAYLRGVGIALAAAAAAGAWMTLRFAAARWPRLDCDAGALALTALGGAAATIALPEGAFLLLLPGVAIPTALLVRGRGLPALLARGAAAAAAASLAGAWIYGLLLALALPGAFVAAGFAAFSAAQLRPLWRAAPTR